MNNQSTHTFTTGKTLLIAAAIAIVLAIVALMIPAVTSLAIELLVGILISAAGVVRMFWAFKIHSLGKGGLLFGLGLVTLIAGVAVLTHPFFAGGSLTMILTVYLLVDGGAELIVAKLLQPLKGWKWLLSGGVISAVLGLMLWLQVPLSGAWAIALALAIKLLMIAVIILKSRTI